jgi:hypothetical protein
MLFPISILNRLVSGDKEFYSFSSCPGVFERKENHLSRLIFWYEGKYYRLNKPELDNPKLARLVFGAKDNPYINCDEVRPVYERVL